MDPVIQLAMALMERPSVTPDDAGCQEFIQKRLEKSGFSAKDYSKNGITNTWYTHGTGEPVFIFCGHTDVVPPGDSKAWNNPPFEPRVIDGMLHGRGACDMKGSVAAMVIAMERFVRDTPNHPGTIALALTSDEEGPAKDGIRHLIEQLPTFKKAVVLTGEPTCPKRFGDMVKPGRRGSMHGTIRIFGEQMHVAYPKDNHNAIHRSAIIIQALDALRWPAAKQFPETSIQCYAMHSDADATNVIPGDVELKWNCRFGVEPGSDGIIQTVKDTLNKTNIPHELSVSISSQPFLTEDAKLTRIMNDAIQKHTGQLPEHSTSGGTSDSRFWATKTYPVIDFGPMNTTIHQVNECVSVKDLITLMGIYTSVLSSYIA